MNDASHDPYRPFGRPQEPEPGEPTAPQASWAPYTPGGPVPPPPAYGQQPYGQQPYGYGAPMPYGVPGHPASYSDKNKTTAGLLQLLLPFVGVCGVGRLYAGHTTIGVLQLVLYWVSFPLVLVFIGFPMLIGIWLWSVIDGIMMLAGEPRDGQGRLLR